MARWSDLAAWRGPTPNQGGRMVEHRGLVIHIADGYYEGTIAWQRQAGTDVSSHFVVAGPRDAGKGVADGMIAQVVGTDVTAWTQRSGNGHWISVEFSGFTGDHLSLAQVEACARLLARAHQVYGVPLQLATSPSGRGLGHHSMGAESGADWGHSACPGEPIKAQKPAILARAKEIAGGGTMPTADEIASAVVGATVTQPEQHWTPDRAPVADEDGTVYTGPLSGRLGPVVAANHVRLVAVRSQVTMLVGLVREVLARLDGQQPAPVVDVDTLAAALARPEVAAAIAAALDAPRQVYLTGTISTDSQAG